jgi:RNA polymerase sigma factor (sigma-70 family)
VKQIQQLVKSAQEGDGDAFTALVRNYQNMAFGYALSILHDFDAAQDATQEALISAYFDLPKLKDVHAFPSWLRGIVRNQCHRVFRNRPSDTVALDHAAELVADGDPQSIHLEKETQLQVLSAIASLSQSLREVTTLYCLDEYSQREVAAFLNVPLATVNNRLHAARTQLKRRMTTMIHDTMQGKKLPEEFATQIGKIVKVRGPVIDVRLETEELPVILDSLMVADGGKQTVFTVAQRLGNGLVRCVAVAPSAQDTAMPPGLKSGTEVLRAENVIDREVSADHLARIVDVFTAAKTKDNTLIETGIKVIDMFCPMTAGCTVGLFGIYGVGKAVLAGELTRRLAADPNGFTLFGLGKRSERPLGQQSMAADPFLGLVDKTGQLEFVWLVTDLASNLEYAQTTDVFDNVIYCSPELAVQGMFPAIDPLVSHSRALDADIVGAEHYEVAQRTRQLLKQAKELMLDPVLLTYLAHDARALAGQRTADYRKVRLAELSEEERQLVTRSHKIELFLTQPFIVAEPYNGKKGVTVPREQTIVACRDIMDGKYDDLSDEAFRMIGAIEEAVAKAAAKI